jgi:hypothetical protein
MTVARAFTITAASGFLCGTLGGLIGYLLGKLAPDYFRTIFRVPPEMEFNPMQAGVGLGLVQGLMTGIGIALLIVIAVTWFEVRKLQAVSTAAPPRELTS